jgi:hypothetical protein
VLRIHQKIKEFNDKLIQQQTPTAKPINITKTVLEFYKRIKNYKTATEAIENALKTEKIKYKDSKTEYMRFLISCDL